MKDKYIDLVRTFAPTVAAALGGPMAGMATKMLSETLLGKPDGKNSELMKAVIGATPEEMIKVQELEKTFELEMEKLGVDVFKMEVEDRKSARLSNKGDKTPAILGVVCFIGFFGILASLIFIDIPQTSQAALTVMLGSLGTIVAQVANYYWGSSKSSSNKNEMIERMMK